MPSDFRTLLRFEFATKPINIFVDCRLVPAKIAHDECAANEAEKRNLAAGPNPKSTHPLSKNPAAWLDPKSSG
jgi:hypothetical protein